MGIAAAPDSTVDSFSRYQHHDFIVHCWWQETPPWLCFWLSRQYVWCEFYKIVQYLITSEHDQILTGPSVQIGCNDIKPYLVGDSAQPLTSWLQKRCPKATRDPEEIAFNIALSGASVAVECAFGMLKNRCRILGKRPDSKISFANKIAVACVVPHNFCLLN